MNARIHPRALPALMAQARAGLVPVSVQAEGTSESWQFQATRHGSFPSIEDDVAFPAGGSGSIRVDSGQVIDSLEFALMGTFGAKKGPWGLWTGLSAAPKRIPGARGGVPQLRLGMVALFLN